MGNKLSKKALIIYRVNRRDSSNLGVINKLIGQVNGLKDQAFNVDYIIHDDMHIYLNNDVIYNRSNWSSHLKFKWSFFDYLRKTNLPQYHLYIIRYGLTTPSFLRWLKQIRQDWNESIILIDMPTYPYRTEWTGIYGKVAICLDHYLNGRLSKYVDYILHSGIEKDVFNIPVILFSNGIQVESIPLRTPTLHDGYRFLAIGKWQFWHGLDRMIKGMNTYMRRGGESVSLDIIGEGPAIDSLKKLTYKYEMGNYVRFCGITTGVELDNIFNSADLGIGTLGLHRKNVKIDSSLKHREYVARGLPFILSGHDRDLSKEEKFALYIASDDSEVDIQELINFVNRLNTGVMLKKMRSYAEEHLSWRIKMSKLMTRIGFKR